jgi:hypothetical protein
LKLQGECIAADLKQFSLLSISPRELLANLNKPLCYFLLSSHFIYLQNNSVELEKEEERNFLHKTFATKCFFMGALQFHSFHFIFLLFHSGVNFE